MRYLSMVGSLLSRLRSQCRAGALPASVPKFQESGVAGLLGSFLDDLEKWAGRRDLPIDERARLTKALPTGLGDLDHLTGGGQPGHLWVVNGPSGVGKTLFALGLARTAAIKSTRPVRWISTRDPLDYLMALVVSAESHVLSSHLRMAAVSDAEWARVARHMGEISEAPLTLIELGEDRLPDYVAHLQDTNTQTDLLIVDALSDPTSEPLLRLLKEYAEASSTWVLVVAADRPSLEPHDAERAQALYADLIAWLSRPDMAEKDSPRAAEADLRISRSRFSATATIAVAFQGHYARLVDLTVR